MAKRGPNIQSTVTLYPIEDVFAAAVAAQRTNECYVSNSTGINTPPNKMTNRHIMTVILNRTDADDFDTCEADYERAKVIIEYYKGKTLEIMSGKANSYTMSAANASYKESVASNDSLTMGLIASLPNAWERSVAYDKTWDRVDELKRKSSHFGSVGEKFEGKVEVLSCIYSKNWFKYYTTALTSTGNIVNFAGDHQYQQGNLVEITTAKIKQHAAENITRLHYVRTKVDKEA
jgi:hypothetical protein